MVLEKKLAFNAKMVGCLKQKNKQKEWSLIFFALKLFHNDFAFYDVCCNMNEESVFEKL
jgi:hypothetical protein